MQKSSLLIYITLFFITFPLFAKDLNLDAIVNEAAKKDAPVLLFFHKPHCGYCDHMIEFTLKDSAIKKRIEKDFIFIDLYTKEDGNISYDGFVGSRREFAKHIGYDFYPTSVFIDSSKKIVHIAPGMLDQVDFLQVLNYITTKRYREMEFQTYLDTLDFDSDL